MRLDTSVVVTTWDRPRHLELVLAGYRRQTADGFELLVADDGSGPETAAVIRRFAERAPFPVRHVHHARRGHRRTVILNRAIAAARGGYVVFSDGDCVPPADFVALHQQLREPDRMLVGGYVRLSPEDTEGAAADWVAAGGHEGYGTRRQWWTVYHRHYKSRLQIALGRRRRPHNLGLNMSLRREHLFRVNGYDERYRGWGNADGDLRERLKCIGVWPRSIWNCCVVYHLHHPPHPTRHDTAANRARARRPRRGFVVEQGIVRLSGGPAADAAL